MISNVVLFAAFAPGAPQSPAIDTPLMNRSVILNGSVATLNVLPDVFQLSLDIQANVLRLTLTGSPGHSYAIGPGE